MKKTISEARIYDPVGKNPFPKNKKRYFIVTPQYDLDFLFKVCSTTSKKPFAEVYAEDLYEEEACFDEEDISKSMKKAISFCRRRGCKRVTQI